MQLHNKGWTAVNGGSSLPTGWCLGQHLIAIGIIRSDQAILTSCTRHSIVCSPCLAVKLNPRLWLLLHKETSCRYQTAHAATEWFLSTLPLPTKTFWP